MNPITNPATCELCGEWMPKHASKCPRNGVHPSQWMTESDEITDADLLLYTLYQIPSQWVENKHCLYF
ncbi:hypothetical protein BY458DRAFT_572553 [Sporodiniella umbellata]|nr:hypothetical protein BY458DRAFT_572553 [Sporodiniella umbellata]